MDQQSIPEKSVAGFTLPVLGLGTWRMGGDYNKSTLTDDKDIAGIQSAIDLGMTHIDTAEFYGQKHTEELVGMAIKKYERDKLFLTSKVWWTHLGYDDLIQAAKESLTRLGIKQLDLYLIHMVNPQVSITETMRAMDFLLENELVKNIGVANFTVPLLKEAQAATKYRIVNNQVHFNVAARAHEENGVLEYCRDNDILVTAYRPLGMESFSDQVKQELDKMANKYKCTVSQIALSWVISHPKVVTLFKSSNVEHQKENLLALDVNLSSEDIAYISNNFPREDTMLVGTHAEYLLD